jgi:hypothetical protein
LHSVLPPGPMSIRRDRMTNLMDDEERVGSSKEHMFQTGITKSGIHPFLINVNDQGFSAGKIFPSEVFIQNINFFHKTNISNL